jgi:lipopolysaccharide transport system permease protein
VSRLEQELSGQQVLVIQASPSWRPVDLPEVWRYRELLYFFVWRDVKVRYKQTILGVTWAVIQPLFAMIIFAFFFGKIARLPSDGVPYPLFSYAGLLPWTFFANAVTSGSQSLLASAHLVTKVYFPRILVPVATVATGVVDFLFALVMIGPLMALFHVRPTVHLLPWIAVAMFVCLLVALGLSFWLSALVVRFRDLRHVVPFAVQIWLFATPIVYPLSMIPARYRWAVDLNPMAPVVEAFRGALFGKDIPVTGLACAAVVGMTLMWSGSIYFRHLERVFADVV